MSTRLLLLRSVTTRLRNIPGAVFFLDAVRKRMVSSGERIVVNNLDGDIRFDADLSAHMGSQIFWFGSYSRHVLRVLDRIMHPGMVALDVGANAGEVALFMAKRVGQQGKVYAFEPVDTTAQFLRTNIALNPSLAPRVEVVRTGLSDAPGEFPIYTSDGLFHDGSHHEGLSTIFPAGPRTKQIQVVSVTTGDHWAEQEGIDHVDLIKIDIEGAELPAINGLMGIITKCKPWLIIEVQDFTSASANYTAEDVLSVLGELGYTFRKIQRDPLPEVTVHNLGKFQNVLAIPVGKDLG